MTCPIDQTTLLMTIREGVEIDYCPTCRGVWLDRGELDKIIERSAGATSQRPADETTRQVEQRSHDDRRHEYEDSNSHDRGHSDKDRYGKKPKRESFLGDIFDF